MKKELMSRNPRDYSEQVLKNVFGCKNNGKKELRKHIFVKNYGYPLKRLRLDYPTMKKNDVIFNDRGLKKIVQNDGIVPIPKIVLSLGLVVYTFVNSDKDGWLNHMRKKSCDAELDYIKLYNDIKDLTKKEEREIGVELSNDLCRVLGL